MQFFLHLIAMCVIWVGVVLNLNTMLYKATPIIRGELTGSELEHALLMVTLTPAAALLSLGLAYYFVWKSYAKRVLKECKKCDGICKKYGKISSSSGGYSG